MPSSPTSASLVFSTPVRTQSLLSVLTALVDPRGRRGRRYPLVGIVAAGIAATLAGACSFAAIASWLADQDAATAVALGLDQRRRMPNESVFRRLFARLDPLVLDGLIGAWMWTTTRVVEGRRVIAIDGKTVRGARTGGASAPHLVAAFDHTAGAVLGQLAVAAKTNEIPTVRTLLRTLDLNGGLNDGLAGAVLTIDAMHTQDDTAALITSAGGDYVFTVKGNRPKLRAALKAIPWKDVPAYSYTEQTKGRRVRRTIKVVAVPTWVAFPGAVQVAQLRRTVTVKGKTTVEVVYVITSAEATPATLATWVQGHWAVENKLHRSGDSLRRSEIPRPRIESRRGRLPAFDRRRRRVRVSRR